MARFYIQGKLLPDGNIIPAHDFGYAALEAVEYDKWYFGANSRHDYKLTHFKSFKCCDDPDIIPVGSVEYVLDFLKVHHGIEHVNPIGIPPVLDQFANRELERVPGLSSLTTLQPVFIKSLTQIKGGFQDIIKGTREFPYDDYLVSDVIDIESEWRCFVYNGNLLDIKCYSHSLSSFGRVPDLNTILFMISKYYSCPKAYTLDVCVDKQGKTSILEVHNFFSCGLYGFEYSSLYLNMLIAGIKWQIEQSKR